MKLEIELPDPPKGWEYTGEYRRLKNGDTGVYYHEDNPELQVWDLGPRTIASYFVLRPVRWRAGAKEVYWYIGADYIVRQTVDRYEPADLRRYKQGNYYQCPEDAEPVAEKMLSLLKESHE